MVEAAHTGVLGTLGIDWKLFLAQLVNFGIVVVVLWKWAYKPLLEVLDKRKKTISESLANAAEIDKRMKRIGAEEGTLMKQAHEKAQGILATAETNAKEHHDLSAAKTQQHVDAMIKNGDAELTAMKAHLLVEAKKDLASVVVAAVEKLVGESANDKVHAELVKKAQKALES